MGLDMVVRLTNGEQADETNTGVIPLYRMVIQSILLFFILPLINYTMVIAPRAC